MDTLALQGNTGSGAYGQDAGGGIIAGSIVKATVVEHLGDDLYLLKVGRQTFEAQVAAELEDGVEYRFVVEKNGQPPELALMDGSQKQSRLANGLTTEENTWITNLARLTGKGEGEFNPKVLLDWVRSLGFDVNQSFEQVFRELKSVLQTLSGIDSAPPVIRQMMGQTLLFTLHHNQRQSTGEAWFDQAIRLSGEIPKWDEGKTNLMLELKKALEALPKDQKEALRSALLGTSSSRTALKEGLAALLRPHFTNAQGQLNSQAMGAFIEELNKDAGMRLFLASSTPKHQNGNFGGSLQRSEAINAFQSQAPGLASTSVTSLLEQFTSLGGSLDRLSYGDVVSSQLSWRGATPSAMQIHRTGAVMHLVQDLPADMRSIQRSELITQAPIDRMPVVLDSGMVSDPSTSALSLSKLQEFSTQSSLPNTYHVDRLLQSWSQSGGSLAELRGNIDSIHSWNHFIEEFPELRNLLADHLLNLPAFGSQGIPTPGADLHAPPPTAEVLPQTRSALYQSLQDSGMDMNTVSKKSVAETLQLVQQVAGEGKVPSKSLLTVATWMLGKGFEMTESSLKSVYQFHTGHLNTSQLLESLPGVQQQIAQQNPELASALDPSLLKPGSEGSSVKDTISFYQKGNGAQLRQWFARALEFLQSQPVRDQALINQLMVLQQRLVGHEEMLAGLKHYNIQAQRQDTPQLYELPVLFGDQQERALLKIYHKGQKGSGNKDEDKNYKVVIDLDLKGLGKVRSEVSLFQKHLQLDFLSPDESSIEVLKARSTELAERLESQDLKANLGFKVKAKLETGIVEEHKTISAPKEKANIDASA
jgi:hypothetical protein